MRIGSLFSGCGALETGVMAALGGTVAWHCENDPAAARVLAHRYPDVPNLGDITAVDWEAVAPVDVLTGGFPCTDVSSAGKRAGLRPGTRSGVWSQMSYAIARLRPQLVIIENVRGLLSTPAHSDVEPCPWCVGDPPAGDILRSCGAVLGDLAGLGYDTQRLGLPASAAGAPHERFRVFILAWPTAADAADLGHERPGDTWGWWAGSADGDSPAADAAIHGRGEGWPEPARFVGGSDAAQRGETAADAARGQRPTAQPEDSQADTDGCDQPGKRAGDPTDGLTDWGVYGPAIDRWERILGRVAPAPTVLNRRGTVKLSPRFVEWMLGLPAGWVTDVPGVSYNEQLTILGNGVVPQQAELAIRTLLGVLDVDEAAA